MNAKNLAAALLGIAASPVCAFAVTIRVPLQQPTIQAGVNAAASGDTVLVAPGIYRGDGNQGVSFYGRDIVLTSETGPGSTIIDIEELPDQAFGIVHGETPAAVVEGFTVRNGYLEIGGGAGMGIANASPTVRNCVFIDNWVGSAYNDVQGGAVAIANGSPTFTNCSFINNRVWSFAEPPGFEARGGAIYAQYSSPQLTSCTFQDNAAIGAGLSGFGGGVFLLASSLEITNCTFNGNRAMEGGGLSSWGSKMLIEKTVIAFSQDGGSIACTSPSGVVIRCSDIFGNLGGDWNAPCIASQSGGEGNISADPLFCNAESGDLHLHANSPCAPGNAPQGCGLIGALPAGCGFTAIQESPSHRSRLSVDPNPISGVAEFSFDEVASPVLEIFDPQGRLVDLLHPLEQRVRWSPAPSRPRGVYFARLRGSGVSETVKFLVIR